jgi:hypothetical protein
MRSSFIWAYTVIISYSTEIWLTVGQFVKVTLLSCKYEFQWVFLSPPLVSDLLKQSTHLFTTVLRTSPSVRLVILRLLVPLGSKSEMMHFSDIKVTFLNTI